MRFTREECLQRVRKVIDDGKAIIGAGAGIGISAKCADIGRADFIIIYGSGRYRMAGRSPIAGFMPFSDANGVVLEMSGEILPVVKNTPVLAGVCAQDPFRFMDQFLKQLIDLGFSGVQNFPTVCSIDGVWREMMEQGGMTYGLEVEMIARAHDLGLLTTPYAVNEEQAIEMAKVGADLLVAHMGGTVGGTIGFGATMKLEQAAIEIQRLAEAAKSVNPEVLVICHGGPIAEPEDAEYIIKHAKDCVGFYGASSVERLPAERAITEQVRKFKRISIS
jgi:predicted TIM-barrel enzyme